MQSYIRLYSEHVDLGSTKASQQSKGDAGHTVSLTTEFPVACIECSTDSVRQPNGCGLSKERRGHQIQIADKFDNESIYFSRSLRHTPFNIPYPRKLQYSCRSTISEQVPSRMASSAGDNPNHFQKIGGTIDLFASRRAHVVPAYCTLDRTDMNVIFHDALSLQWHFQNAWVFSLPHLIPRVQSQRNIYINSTSLGECFLETTPQKSSSEPTFHDQELGGKSYKYSDGSLAVSSRENDTRGMEMRGRHQKITGWSESQKSLSSWRESTLKIYRPEWNRWVSWSERENVDPFHPDGSYVAIFLPDLHQKENLSLSTILVYKSVIATFA